MHLNTFTNTRSLYSLRGTSLSYIKSAWSNSNIYIYYLKSIYLYHVNGLVVSWELDIGFFLQNTINKYHPYFLDLSYTREFNELSDNGKRNIHAPSVIDLANCTIWAFCI